MAKSVVTIPKDFQDKLHAAEQAIDNKLALLGARNQFLLDLNIVIFNETKYQVQIANDLDISLDHGKTLQQLIDIKLAQLNNSIKDGERTESQRLEDINKLSTTIQGEANKTVKQQLNSKFEEIYSQLEKIWHQLVRDLVYDEDKDAQAGGLIIEYFRAKANEWMSKKMAESKALQQYVFGEGLANTTYCPRKFLIASLYEKTKDQQEYQAIHAELKSLFDRYKGTAIIGDSAFSEADKALLGQWIDSIYPSTKDETINQTFKGFVTVGYSAYACILNSTGGVLGRTALDNVVSLQEHIDSLIKQLLVAELNDMLKRALKLPVAKLKLVYDQLKSQLVEQLAPLLEEIGDLTFKSSLSSPQRKKLTTQQEKLNLLKELIKKFKEDQELTALQAVLKSKKLQAVLNNADKQWLQTLKDGLQQKCKNIDVNLCCFNPYLLIDAFKKIGEFKQARSPFSAPKETSLDVMVTRKVEELRCGSSGSVGALELVLKTKERIVGLEESRDNLASLRKQQHELTECRRIKTELERLKGRVERLTKLETKHKEFLEGFRAINQQEGQQLTLLKSQVEAAFNKRKNLEGVSCSAEKRFHRENGLNYAHKFNQSIQNAENFSQACNLLKTYLNQAQVKFRDHSFASYLLIELFENEQGIFSVPYDSSLSSTLKAQKLDASAGLDGLGSTEEAVGANLDAKIQILLNPPKVAQNDQPSLKLVEAYKSEVTFRASWCSLFASNKQCRQGGIRATLRATVSERLEQMASLATPSAA